MKWIKLKNHCYSIFHQTMSISAAEEQELLWMGYYYKVFDYLYKISFCWRFILWLWIILYVCYSIFYEPRPFYLSPKALQEAENGGVGLISGKKVYTFDSIFGPHIH